ncbi:MAG TPA: DNA-3-methyladenine glycosylase I [Bryobacteraceae bacterium]|nr:DNA-3-methyladenine glycosylase I [Bryobacteraceae bacterium]
MNERVFKGDDERVRCAWCRSTPEYVLYHDTEWGFPVTADQRLFEKISLEGFQAGLSWLTILKKRDAFRHAFADFDFEKVARFTRADVDRLLADAAIVRHRGKIESTVNNARRACDLATEFGSLSAYFWRSPARDAQALAQDLKKRRWTFVGPTTIYAFMQAMGLVNDHMPQCFVHARAEEARSAIFGNSLRPGL